MQQILRDEGWAILRDGTPQDGQRGSAFLKKSVAPDLAPGDANYLWVPGYSPQNEMPSVDPPGSMLVAGSQLQWLE